MTFTRSPAGDDPLWPRASAWLAGELDVAPPAGAPRVEVLGVPCSVGSISPSEAWRTPPAVRQALARLSPYDPTTGTDLPGAVHLTDLGDLDVADLPLEEALQVVADAAGALVRDALTVAVGGDNAITRPLVRGRCGPDLSRVGLLTLDAHHDVRHLDDGPRNGTPVRGLLADGLPGGNVVQVGIGAFTNSAAYAAWCRDAGITTVTAAEVHARGVDAVLDDALAHLAGCDVVAVDLDVDVLDVAFAPACPGARPGGLTPTQLFDVARRVGADPRVAVVDLVEVDAAADHDGRTVMATAMALLAVLAGVARRPGGASVQTR
ncbi:MAG: arginase family protein [Actinomycetes bacterium]